jgi:uncharacterized coiled-coil protein SlyX
MRKSSVVALALVSVLLLGTTALYFSKYKQSVTSFTDLKAENESTQLRYSHAIGEIATIQDSLNAIVLGEDAVALPAASNAEMDLPGTQKDQVLTRIAMLKAAIERTKDRIEILDARLKKNGVRMAGMEKMIAGLKRSLAEKEVRISELTVQVDTLQSQVTGLNVAVANQKYEIDTKQEELATVFYTMGSKKDLIKTGVVTSNGGVLGVGKTLKPSGYFNGATLTPMNTDQETIIQIPAEKAQVLTPQPTSSYVIEPVSKDMVQLRIVDPKEFRKVKQVVILTT